MKEIPRKNYFILLILILVTIVLTLSITQIYRNKKEVNSYFYDYSNKINSRDFDEYITENSDLIIYISDKQDLSHENFEKDFSKEIDDMNLKNKLIFIDKSELTKTFLEKLDTMYNVKIDKSKLPMILVIVDKNIVEVSYVTLDSDYKSIINYEAIE